MGKYKRKLGARPYLTNYTSVDLQNAVQCVRDGQTFGKAAAQFHVPKSTLYRKVRGTQTRKHGGQLKQKVMEKLPGSQITKDTGGDGTLEILIESCLVVLKQHCAAPSIQKRKRRGKNVVPGKPVHNLQSEKEETWVCQYCQVTWKDDDNRWIVCDICDNAFHLQCSGLQYKRQQYYELDVDGLTFSCDECL